MNDTQIAGLAKRALEPILGSLGLERGEVAPGRDHDDTPSLFVTAYYRAGSTVPKGDVLLKALGSLHKAFIDAGEERFPYLDHRFSDGEAFEDEAVDDEAAPPR